MYQLSIGWPNMHSSMDICSRQGMPQAQHYTYSWGHSTRGKSHYRSISLSAADSCTYSMYSSRLVDFLAHYTPLDRPHCTISGLSGIDNAHTDSSNNCQYQIYPQRGCTARLDMSNNGYIRCLHTSTGSESVTPP